VPGPEIVQGKDSGPGRGEIQKNEAEDDGQLAVIHHGPESSWQVHQEVRDGHLTGEQECHRPREEPEYDEHAADEFDWTCKAPQREAHARRITSAIDSTKQTKQLLRAVLQQERAGEDPEKDVRPAGGRGVLCMYVSHDLELQENRKLTNGAVASWPGLLASTP
jgi:hypothetical protein